jgi:hypothetical protein
MLPRVAARIKSQQDEKRSICYSNCVVIIAMRDGFHLAERNRLHRYGGAVNGRHGATNFE